jgi:hypothetical protein
MGNSKTDILSEYTAKWCLAQLEYPLRPGKIKDFRRFINTFIGADNDLFHNHKTTTTVHYRYPLVQYKTIEQRAAIMGITDVGVAALHDLMANTEFRTRCTEWIGEQFAVTTETKETLTLSTACNQTFHIHKYLCFNQENIKKWNSYTSIAKKAALIEQCIVAHILKFASGIQWQLPPRALEVNLLDFKPYQTKAHDRSFLAFEVDFQTNITLPEYIGLGKSVSLGFGVLHSK